MSDAVATELSAIGEINKDAYKTETASTAQILERAVSPVNFLNTQGRLTQEGRTYLGQLAGNNDLKRIGGGTSKEVYLDNKHKKVFALVQTANSVGAEQARNQARFYKKFSQDPDLQKITVLPTKIIENQAGDTLGTEQPFYGESFAEYSKRGMTLEGAKVTKASIDRFIDSYRKVIVRTGQAHGDFVIGTMKNKDQVIFISDLENIRIGPNGDIKFIDYNGRNGMIGFNGVWKTSDSGYDLIRDSDPDRVQTALYKLFAASR